MQKKYTLEELNLMTVHDLRIILAKLSGTPGQKSRAEMIEEITAIQIGRLKPQRSARGRKPKYTKIEPILMDSENDLEHANSPALNVNSSNEKADNLENFEEFQVEQSAFVGKDNVEESGFRPAKIASLNSDYVFPERKDANFSNVYKDVKAPEKLMVADSGAYVPTTVVGYGLLEVSEQGYGVLRNINYGSNAPNAYVNEQIVTDYRLKTGDFVIGYAVKTQDGSRFEITYPVKINNYHARIDCVHRGKPFESLTAEYVKNPIKLDNSGDETLRLIDIITPVGKGQRGIIVAPSESGNSTLLKKIAHSISGNYPEIHLITLLLEERPEEITDFSKIIKTGELVATTFEQSPESHVRYAELYLERAKRLVELGKDVIILMDSLTKLARAYAKTCNNNFENALAVIKRYFASARKIVDGGSLTLITTITQSESDFDIQLLKEIENSANLKIVLTRTLAKSRIYPAFNIVNCGTKKAELLQTEKQMQTACKLCDLVSEKGEKIGTLTILEMLKQTADNNELCNKIDDFLLAING